MLKSFTTSNFMLLGLIFLFALLQSACSGSESGPAQDKANNLQSDGDQPAQEVAISDLDSDESLWYQATPDPTQVAPQNFTVLADAGFIRVVHLKLPAGASVGTHSHPPSAMYVPQDCELIYTQDGGAERRLNLHAGLCIFADPILDRQVANPSDKDAELLFLELRDTTNRKFSGPDPLEYDKVSFRQLVDNKHMRCLSLKLAAGDSTQVIALRPFAAWMQTGESISMLRHSDRKLSEFKAADAIAFSGTPSEPFRFVNTGENPIHLIIAEDK